MIADCRAPKSRRAAGPTALISLLALLFAAGEAGAGQAVEVQAGSSSLYDARGASVELRGSTVGLSLGAGEFHDQFTVGARLQKSTRGATYTFGDNTLDFQLPTDVFGGGYYVPVRGAGVTVERQERRLAGFVGATSVNVGAPFFRGAQWGRPVGLLFVDLPEGRRWRIASRNVVTDRVTSIHGVQWRVVPDLELAATAGLARGRLYSSSSATVDHAWFKTAVSYATPDAGFRRIDPRSPMASEVQGWNVSTTVAPKAWMSISAARRNLVDGDAAAGESSHATVNQISGTVNVAETRLGAALFESALGPATNLGTSLSLGRRVGDSIDAGVDYFASTGTNVGHSGSLVSRVQETLTPRLSLLQVVTRTADQTSVNVGGQIISNVISAGIGYQTIYAPFRRGNPFVQTLALDFRLQLLGVHVQLGTYAMPDGRVRFTVAGSRFLASPPRSNQTRPVKFATYLIRGSVRELDGRPVSGASIQLGQEIVITDEDGTFFLRTDTKRKLPVKVLTKEFTAHGNFEVVSAPAESTPAPEFEATEIQIVLRRY